MHVTSLLRYERRSAVAEALKTANNQTEKLVSWTPKANRCSKIVEAGCPSLQDMCIDVVATHIEACLEFGLGSILPEMKVMELTIHCTLCQCIEFQVAICFVRWFHEFCLLIKVNRQKFANCWVKRGSCLQKSFQSSLIRRHPFSLCRIAAR